MTPWTPEDDARLRAIYATASSLDLKRAFPGRGYHAIRRHANALGLSRKKFRDTGRLFYRDR